jgi:hypothetical protein
METHTALAHPTAGPTLGADAVPLVLLAALAHRDPCVRLRLAARLDALIEQRGPIDHEHKVRTFLARQRGSPTEPFFLDGLPLELAIRVVRLIYADATRKHQKRWLRIVSPEGFEEAGGLLVRYPPLRCHPAAQPPAGERWRKARMGTHLLTGVALARLDAFTRRRPFVRAMCRLGSSVQLWLSGDLSWGETHAILSGARLSTGRPLESLGMTCARTGDGVHFEGNSPEAMIQFSACLARGERLVLTARPGKSPHDLTQVYVALDDFDGGEAELGCLACPAGEESWLTWLPPLALEIPLEDRVAIARWAYAPASWLTPELMRSLL